MRRFADRADAGEQLAAELTRRDISAEVVIGLPRGGVVVAAPVAAALGAELDTAIVRKIGLPWRPEVGVGAVAEDEIAQFDRRSLALAGIDEDDLGPTVAREIDELHRRQQLYRSGAPARPVTGRRVLVVDDGLATGVTARAALRWLRRMEPAWLGFAAPVCAPDSVGTLEVDADAVCCALCPSHFAAVGQWYVDFPQTSDAEVVRILGASTHAR